MSMKQNIEIDGKQVPFRASAAIPRIYRMKFHRDIYKDLRALEKSLGEGNPEEWLDGFNTFSIYQVIPKLIELWGLNTQTEVESKKARPTDREMTTSLFLLRCVQLGLSIRDLDLLTIGMVNDMFAERRNDDCKHATLASQEDFDKF